MADWQIAYHSAYNPDGSLFFPERLTHQFLDEAKRHMGTQFFANQYLNVVMDEHSKPFKVKWLKYYDQIPDNVHRYAFIDPAISQADSADFTAVVVVAVDEKDNWYLEYAARFKITPTNIINLLFQLYERFKPRRIGIESVAFQEVLVYNAYEEMKRRNVMIPVEGIKPRTDRTKVMKILGLIPRFEWSRVFINHGLDDFELEYKDYAGERSKTDDILDALASIDELISYPDPEKEEIKEVPSNHPMYEHYYRLKLMRGDRSRQ